MRYIGFTVPTTQGDVVAVLLDLQERVMDVKPIQREPETVRATQATSKLHLEVLREKVNLSEVDNSSGLSQELAETHV